MLVVFLVEVLDDSVRDPQDVRHETRDGNLAAAGQPRSLAAEAYRSLRTNLQFASPNRPIRTLLVTSPLPGDGKTSVAANLGAVLAQGGRKVAIIDADLRRPQLHRYLGLPNREGLGELFLRVQAAGEGGDGPDLELQATSVPGLRALTSGSLPPNPAELLGSERMASILEQAGERADLVLIDSPPVLAVTDAVLLAARADGVLLVLKPSTTKTAACRHALEQLRRSGANVLGVVLNGVEIKSSPYSDYHCRGYPAGGEPGGTEPGPGARRLIKQSQGAATSRPSFNNIVQYTQNVT